MAEDGRTVPKRGTILPRRGSSGGTPMTADVVGARIGVALRDRYGGRRFAAKLVARLADGSERAARNLLSGAGGPRAAVLIRLMAREPAVADVVRELVEEQRRLDAELLARRTRRGQAAAPGTATVTAARTAA